MLRRTPRAEGEKDEPVYGTHIGDMGIILIAALLTFTWIAVLVMPSPFARLEQAQAAREKAQIAKAKADRQKEIDKAVASGEVSVGIAPGH